MSRIKDALNKAKLEREGAAPASQQDRPVARPDSKPAPHSLQTSVINYSESAVKKHRLITPYLEDVSIIERFKLLRTKFFSETQTNDDRTILITSSLEGEGKTFISLNLAITIAREMDQTALVVDVNFKNPSVLNCFGIKTDSGLTEHLLYDKPLSAVLVRPGSEKLVLLPEGKPEENSAELLRSRKMQDLVNEIKLRYEDRYILFDGPDLLSNVDAMVFSKYVDRTLFVLEAGRVPPDKVSEALRSLEKDKILGVILNKKT